MLLVFTLLHSVLQSQICLLFQVFLDFLLRLSGEALQIAVKRRETKSKGEKEKKEKRETREERRMGKNFFSL